MESQDNGNLVTREDILQIVNIIIDDFESLDFDVDDIYIRTEPDGDYPQAYNRTISDIKEGDLPEGHPLDPIFGFGISIPFSIDSNGDFEQLCDLQIEYMNLFKSVSKKILSLDYEISPYSFWINYDDNSVIMEINKIEE